MEEPNIETASFAFDLFDRYGRLRNELKTHPVRKGSGKWNEELDNGDLLLLEKVEVDAEYRKRGLGKMMVEALLEKARQKSTSFFTIAWATLLQVGPLDEQLRRLKGVERDKVWDCEEGKVVGFFRSLGFRRIGSSPWFAFAEDINHPARLLDSMAGFNPPWVDRRVIDPILQPAQQLLLKS